MKRWIVLLFPLALTACAMASVESEGPGRHQIGDAYYISTSRSWTHFETPAGEFWTVHGATLGRLRTWAEVKDGEPLVEVDDRTMPTYKAGSTAVDVSELVADTVEALAAGADVEVTGLRPANFGSREGFRFEIYLVDNGLPIRGMALGSIETGALNLLLFTAPSEYYFDLYKPEVESILTSVTT
jgi:hypothetical protein